MVIKIPIKCISKTPIYIVLETLVKETFHHCKVFEIIGHKKNKDS